MSMIFNVSALHSLPQLLPFLLCSEDAHALSQNLSSHCGFALRLSVQDLTLLSESSQAGLTKYHGLGDLRNRGLFSYISRGWDSKVRAPAPSGSGEGSLPNLHTATSLLCLHTGMEPIFPSSFLGGYGAYRIRTPPL